MIPLLRVLFFALFAFYVIGVAIAGALGARMGTHTFQYVVITLLAYIGMSILLGQMDDDDL